jgi:exodeoxyribonuclease VII small subunit
MAVKKKSKPSPGNFEASMEELESLVAEMESGELTLEESLEHFERGIRQVRNCQKALDEAEQKVQILLKESGDQQLADFEPDSE